MYEQTDESLYWQQPQIHAATVLENVPPHWKSRQEQEHPDTSV